MSSQGQGVLEGETHGLGYQRQGEDLAVPMLNGSGNGESGRSVSYGAASGTQDRVLESSEAGVTSATRDDVHNIH